MSLQAAPNPLTAANLAYRDGQSAAAMAGYVTALRQMPELSQIIATSITRTRQQYLASRTANNALKVVVCGWELAHNSAGRAHTLAEIYREFAQVEIIGSIFPGWGSEIWEPMRGTTIPVDSFLVTPNRFLEQALALVSAHPADVVHLSKPRGPNIFFGIFYKLLWGARVVLDIDDEELAFVQAQTPLTVSDYLQQHQTLPPLGQIHAAAWTRLAVGLVQEFDAITVSNSALQARYGGDIIGHARDPRILTPSAELRRASRDAHGIRPDEKVILFSGTPRPHKGLLEVAHAIQSLQRTDVRFVIVGSFGEKYQSLKAKLKEVQGVNYLFLENQPFAALPHTLAIADCCVLLQDPAHPYAPFQVPAKLSDALAMGIPVIATATPALTDPIAAGAVTPATAENLAVQIAFAFKHPNATLIEAGHRYFTDHLTIAANATRLRQLLSTTRAQPISPVLRQLPKLLADETFIQPALLALVQPHTGGNALRRHTHRHAPI